MARRRQPGRVQNPIRTVVLVEWSVTNSEGSIVLHAAPSETILTYRLELWTFGATGAPERVWSDVLDSYGAEPTDVEATSGLYWAEIRTDLGELAWRNNPEELS